MDGPGRRRADQQRSVPASHRVDYEQPAGGEKDAMDLVTHGAPASDQRPVSVLGWSLALLVGGMIWALIFALLAGLA